MRLFGRALICPSGTFHCGGWAWSPTHWERSLPSNNTTASDGAWPGLSCVLEVAGSMTGGIGRSGSFGFQRGSTCARESCEMHSDKSKAERIVFMGNVSMDKIHEIAKMKKYGTTSLKE